VKDLIKKLTETYGPSGSEERVRQSIREEIETSGVLKRPDTSLSVDPMGNLIFRMKGANGGRRVMLAAHMDEIGVMVTHVEEKGFLRFTNIGGLEALNILGQRVLFASVAIGVIGVEELEEKTRIPRLDKYYIDVGAVDKASCPVKVGDAACFVSGLQAVGNRLTAKAMDDRIGCAVLLEVMGSLAKSPHDVSFVFTVQEEVGLRGATASGYGVDPELAVVVDITDTGDTPECLPMAVSLGGGPAIKVKDAGMLAHVGLKDWLVRSAEKAHVPFQLEVMSGGTTDARAIQTSRAGVPSGCISIPCRYAHTPSELVDLTDAEGAVKILVHALSRPIEGV
jgi:putative aminopeptidase FrvX